MLLTYLLDLMSRYMLSYMPKTNPYSVPPRCFCDSLAGLWHFLLCHIMKGNINAMHVLLLLFAGGAATWSSTCCMTGASSLVWMVDVWSLSWCLHLPLLHGSIMWFQSQDHQRLSWWRCFRSQGPGYSLWRGLWSSQAQVLQPCSAFQGGFPFAWAASGLLGPRAVYRLWLKQAHACAFSCGL